MAFYRYTGTETSAAPITYPSLDVTVYAGRIVDFGNYAPPSDGKWTSDPGPANAGVASPSPSPSRGVYRSGLAVNRPAASTFGEGHWFSTDTGSFDYSDGTSWTTGFLTGTFSTVGGSRPGNRFVFLGDSTTVGSDDPVNQARGDSWPVYASILSGQKIRYVRNAGLFGDTTTQMLARFDTAVTPYAPNVVTIMGGTNDTGTGVPLATFQSNITAMVAKTRAIGAVPVLCTILPNSSGSPTNRRQLVVQFNAWIRRYAATQGLLCLDFYNLIADPTNGNFLSAYNNDGTHPNAAGYAAMGSYANTTLSPILQPVAPLICQDDVDENNLTYKGCLGGYSGSALPTTFVDNIGGVTGSVLSYTTDAAVTGQMLTITNTASSGNRQIGSTTFSNLATTTMPTTTVGATSLSLSATPGSRGVLYIGSGSTYEIAKVASVTGSGPYSVTLARGLVYGHAAGEQVVLNGAPGDTILISGVVTTDGGCQVSAGLVATPALTGYKAMAALTRPITRGVFMQEYVIPAGTTQIESFIQTAAGTGTSSWGQLGFYNLTRMGV
jgi:lysophospholipase L1-like esterase